MKTNNWKKYKCILLLCFTLPCIMIGQIEICDNGIDDDNDGQIDLNDEDCICELPLPPSLIPNPSFEEMDCCPNDMSQLDCATDWIQASNATTDFIHACGWFGWDDFPPPEPFPDGEGIMGFRNGRLNSAYWKEYAGACLIDPLLTSITYRFQFDVGFVNPQYSPPIDISFFGTPNCDFLPFGDSYFGCPTIDSNWIKLGDVKVSGGAGNSWVNTFIEITPQQDIYAIAIGPDCEPNLNKTFYFFDNLILADLSSFGPQISPTTHPCESDFSLSVPNNPDYEYQWYLEGVALVGEVFSELTQNYGVGDYQVRIIEDGLCSVSEVYNYFIPTYNATETVSICSGEFYELGGVQLTTSGTYIDTLKTQNNCDSIVILELEIISEEYETVEVSIFEGETFEYEGNSYNTPGEYLLTLPSPSGCERFVSLTLKRLNVFIPNAFSPNGDGYNDLFLPLTSSGKIESTNMKIFDRWGNLVYEGAEWDGSDMNPGVFVYLMDIEFTHGTSRSFSGSVTLMK